MNYIKLIFCFSAFLIPIFLFYSASSAHPGQTFEVNVDWLPILKSPTDSAEIVGNLKRGDKVTAFKEQAGWLQTYYQGREVWVLSKHLLPMEEQETFLIEGLLVGYTIIIDPGHGGKDPGAIGSNGVLEKDLILNSSLKIAETLRQAGANVILTREDDSFVSLKNRVLIGNKHNTSAFISIHYNAFSESYVGGFSTFYNQSGKDLAHHIQTALAAEIPLRNRGISPGSFTVLHESNFPAILLELGFITNASEVATLQTESYQEQVARAITIGLIEYFWD
ncbi:N-acetylmuramoyl-L-alanine amidase [Ornithinibacillus halotolerans]|uniref:MurNAc-LAA domain-containing protein n=1 Tax=Ornithinibacillus halotolerans TaxID=1274357 RepID=A0A916WB18_9BACI|nr:N-acetylmuramoyl-L-alanine amidase [Ornithinibacillus halotolerans]GGA82852.1 hypothetical protein GCM10008025_27490 [Ornithinibacillus halotolerans]